MSVLRAIGLMSGTSMDGIDVAALATDGEAVVERGPSHFVAYEAAFRARIAAALEVAKTIGKREERPGELQSPSICSSRARAEKSYAERAILQGPSPASTADTSLSGRVVFGRVP